MNRGEMKTKEDQVGKLSDPLVSLLLRVSEDDEETTNEEDEAAAEAWQEDLEEGGRDWEQVRREL